MKAVFMKFAGFYWVNRNFFKILNVALLCGASKGSMKALKNLIFISIQLSEIHRMLRVKDY